jgi:putative transposase
MPSENPCVVDWPHAPLHRLGASGAYIITAGTYLKEHYFRKREELLQDLLFDFVRAHSFDLQAWSLFSNHYHIVITSDQPRTSLQPMIRELHSVSARELNRLDGIRGRKVWFQYWDKHLTFERSYLARLNYVHQNAVHHGLVSLATNYRWCSASWFEERVSRAYAESVRRFQGDRLNVPDDFEPDD